MKRLLIPVVASLIAVKAQAESFVISDIRVNGLQRVSAGSVFSALPLNTGDTITDQGLVEATRALFRTGFFQDIQLGRDGNVLVITVVERPSISKIEIEGNKAIKTEDLMKGLQQSGLSDGEIFQQATLDSIRNELQRQYVAQGRYSATIEAETMPQPRNRVAVKIRINEGSVAAIKHINIVGNSLFPDDDLTRLFVLKTTNLLSFFRNDDKYSREKLSGDLERLRSYYLDRGYINMDITSTQVSITPDKKSVYITINIVEGDQYKIRDVKLSGDLKVPREEVEALLLSQPGQIFSRKVMTTTSEMITRRLGNEGYTFANVNGVPEPHEDDRTVSLTFVIDPGRRAYVHRINFRGNTKTDDEVLRREMRQMEGGWASTYLIDQSKTRLERLGYFKTVTVETPAVPGTDDQVDVNYTVEEQASGSVSASVGFAQNSGIILGGSIDQSNFLGTGNRVSLGLNRSSYQTSYNFSFVDPYWTEDGISFGYNGFYRTSNYKKLNYSITSYSIDSFGGGVNIGYPISETSRLSFGAGVERDKISTGDYTVDEIFEFLDKEGKSYMNFNASAAWSESTLNRGVLPTRGGSQSLAFETTVPGSDLYFYKLDYDGQVFFPMTDDYTLRLHTKLGYGNSFGSTSRMPFYEHYYAGGFSTVRGFQDNTLGPRSTPSSGANGTEVDTSSPQPYGGNILVTGGAEMLFPVPFIKDQNSFRTSVFWDAGNVFDSNCLKSESDCSNVKLSNLAHSVGVGGTWVSGFGPLSFSLALPVKTPKNAKTQFFQFSMGQTF